MSTGPLHGRFSALELELERLGEAENKDLEGDESSFVENVGDILQTLDDVKASADIAVDLVSDLLLYDRLDEGALKLEKVPLKLWKLVRDTMALFKVQVGLAVVLLEIQNELFDYYRKYCVLWGVEGTSL